MKVKFIGGPFDGVINDVAANDRGAPPNEIWRYAPSSSRELTADDFARICNSPHNPEPEAQPLLYKLVSVYKTDTQHDYEYHYQGR
jgi:hypothetical protein